MNAKDRVEWFNVRDPLNKWKVGQDVYCLHCEAVFKAEDIGVDSDGLPECPSCGATPLDLHHVPWWREDLTNDSKQWLVPPIRAVAGRVGKLPAAPWNQRN